MPLPPLMKGPGARRRRMRRERDGDHDHSTMTPTTPAPATRNRVVFSSRVRRRRLLRGRGTDGDSSCEEVGDDDNGVENATSGATPGARRRRPGECRRAALRSTPGTVLLILLLAGGGGAWATPPGGGTRRVVSAERLPRAFTTYKLSPSLNLPEEVSNEKQDELELSAASAQSQPLFNDLPRAQARINGEDGEDTGDGDVDDAAAEQQEEEDGTARNGEETTAAEEGGGDDGGDGDGGNSTASETDGDGGTPAEGGDDGDGEVKEAPPSEAGAEVPATEPPSTPSPVAAPAEEEEVTTTPAPVTPSPTPQPIQVQTESPTREPSDPPPPTPTPPQPQPQPQPEPEPQPQPTGEEPTGGDPSAPTTGGVEQPSSGGGGGGECQDDPAFRYNNNPDRDCGWAARGGRRCDNGVTLLGGDGQAIEEMQIWQFCPVSCDACTGTEPAPTAVVVEGPAPAPAPAPSPAGPADPTDDASPATTPSPVSPQQPTGGGGVQPPATPSPTPAPTYPLNPTTATVQHLTMTLSLMRPFRDVSSSTTEEDEDDDEIDAALRHWEETTTAYVEDYWKFRQSDRTVVDLDVVGTTFVSQDPPFGRRAGNKAAAAGQQPQQRSSSGGDGDGSDRGRGRLRRVQQDGGDGANYDDQPVELLVRYSQTVSYRYLNVNYTTLEDLVTDPFNNLNKRKSYMDRLKDVDSSSSNLDGSDAEAFDELRTVYQVKIVPPPPGGDGGDEGGGGGGVLSDELMFYIIVGAASGGAAVLIGAVLCLVWSRHRRSKRKRQEKLEAMGGGGKGGGRGGKGRGKGGRGDGLSRTESMRSSAKGGGVGGGGGGKAGGGGEGGGPKKEQGIAMDLATMMGPPQDARVDQMIDVESMREDDISTLGDPLSPYKEYGLIRTTTRESIKSESSTVQYDFDYSKAYGGVGDTPSLSTAGATGDKSGNKGTADGDGDAKNASVLTSGTLLTEPESGLGGSSTVFSDEDSFEQQFGYPEERIEILAPPGKLGVVIDTFDGDAAGVNAIKEDSVLADRLRLGDILVSVDGQDTSGMTALQVSKMIGDKAENPERRLVFVRKLLVD